MSTSVDNATNAESGEQTMAIVYWPTKSECDDALLALQRATGVKVGIKEWDQNCQRSPRSFAVCLAGALTPEDATHCGEARKLESGGFLEHHVMFLYPRSWKVVSHEDTAERAFVAFVLPFAVTDDTPHSANVVVGVEKLAGGEDLRAFSNKSLSVGARLERLSDENPRENTRLVTSKGEQDGTRYTVIDFFTLNQAGNIGVSIRLAYPNLPGSASWKGPADFHSVVASLKFTDIP
jgi:hypothetical protein